MITILLLVGLANSNLKASQLQAKNIVVVIIDNAIVVISADNTGDETNNRLWVTTSKEMTTNDSTLHFDIFEKGELVSQQDLKIPFMGYT